MEPRSTILMHTLWFGIGEFAAGVFYAMIDRRPFHRISDQKTLLEIGVWGAYFLAIFMATIFGGWLRLRWGREHLAVRSYRFSSFVFGLLHMPIWIGVIELAVACRLPNTVIAWIDAAVCLGPVLLAEALIRIECRARRHSSNG